ncbi:3299_t:CDS:2 [Cetraspora pellucida]|uniref:3299_t:CDS:1 n=1 Tax=Cetraspora pellucida TaxID=1433469 RepID=A0ACA9JZS3_9GLOM|nr:3299_t:CDS:2 [Cetraspora pellucida]
MPKTEEKKLSKKKQIHDRKKSNPGLRDDEIAAEFNCERSTVSKILKQTKWSEVQETSNTASALRITGPKFPQIEQALGMWIGTVEQQQLTLTGDVIRQKALYFATLLGVSENEFKASEGWLSRFKARAGLRNYRIHGEAESAPIEFLPHFREELKNLLKAYEPQNIFNADECGITSYNQLPVDYYYNEKAWMRQDIFKGVEEPNKIDVLQAIRIVKTAWDAVSIEVIKNCWRHTGILPFQHLVKIFPEMETTVDEDYEVQNVQISEIDTAHREAQEIIDLTGDTNLKQLTQEYLDDNEPIITEEIMDDNRIIELIKNPDKNDDKSEDPVDEEPKITFVEAKQSLNQILKFIRQQSLQPDSFIKENDEDIFRNFLSRTHRAAAKVAKQSTLEHLIIHK